MMDEVARKDALARIARAGVVGAGGAGFPCHVKLDVRVDTVMANGAECEPLLGCDLAAMEAWLPDFLSGLESACDLTGAGRGIIGIKEKHHELCDTIEAALAAHPRLSLLRMGNYYPAGDEVILIEVGTGRVVPEGGLPKDVGVVVQNVYTLINLARALCGEAVTRRLVTVAGEVQRPQTRMVSVGTRIGDLLEAAGGTTCEDPRPPPRGAHDGQGLRRPRYAHHQDPGRGYRPQPGPPPDRGPPGLSFPPGRPGPLGLLPVQLLHRPLPPASSWAMT